MRTGISAPKQLKQARHMTSADDRAILNVHQQDRIAEYRTLNSDWPPKCRSASAPPRYADNHTYVAHQPTQEPHQCDSGHRVDEYPPKDLPLHLHIQAYALRWGTWTAGIKDEEVRQGVLNSVCEKMKKAWESAIRDNYYNRPTVSLADADCRGSTGNETEFQVKKARRTATDKSERPAGFACEGKDPLAITIGELADHGLTMDMINERARRRDFDAGEEKLDRVLTELGRDQLIPSDWSDFGLDFSTTGRDLLMYSLFVVMQCRHECKMLRVRLAKFSSETQKKNTRSRIEIQQVRESQHLALVSEMELTQRGGSSEQICNGEEGRHDVALSTEGNAVSFALNARRRSTAQRSLNTASLRPSLDHERYVTTSSSEAGSPIQNDIHPSPCDRNFANRQDARSSDRPTSYRPPSSTDHILQSRSTRESTRDSKDRIQDLEPRSADIRPARRGIKRGSSAFRSSDDEGSRGCGWNKRRKKDFLASNEHEKEWFSSRRERKEYWVDA